MSSIASTSGRGIDLRQRRVVIDDIERCTRGLRGQRPRRRGSSETEGLRRGGKLSPFRCGSRGDREAGSDVFVVVRCGSRGDDPVGFDVFVVVFPRNDALANKAACFRRSFSAAF
jgi:hypothetical protein